MRVLLIGMIVGTAAATPMKARAQQGVEGTLVVQQGGREIGREHFSVRPGRDRGVAGSTLTVEARYPSARLTASAILQRAENGALSLFKLRVEGPDGPVSIL